MSSSKWRVKEPTRLIDALKYRFCSHFSARYLKKMVETNHCRVNGRVERFASTRIHKGDEIEFLKKEEISPLPQVLYEDDSLLVLNKPARLVCSSDSIKRSIELNFENEQKELFLVHRLDRDTTGILLIAKKASIANELKQKFSQRCIQKTYLALVDGIPFKAKGEIQSYLTKKSSFQGQTIWGSSPANTGSFAHTKWEKIATGSKQALLVCHPVTGRTHQLRVHCAEMGHPLLVDRQYAKSFSSSLFATRPLLHSYAISFEIHQKSFSFQAPLPLDFQQALKEGSFELAQDSVEESITAYLQSSLT